MKKLSIIFFSYLAIIFLNGCLKCSEVLPNYDFGGVEFVYQNGLVIASESEFILEIYEADIEYLSENEFSFSLLSTAYGTEKCEEPGYAGKKYGIASISITSDNDWDEGHPSGTLLNELVFVGELTYNSEKQETEYIYDTPLDEFSLFPADNTGYFLKFSRPVSSNEHSFTFKFEKTNGEVVEATTEAIAWE